MVSKDQIQQFQKKILDWYETHKRDLPWRDCGNPYWVLVSETMLQQTQVDRVIPKFLQFIEKVPDLQALASLERKILLQLRSGLGFNSRALRLQEMARNLKLKAQSLKLQGKSITIPDTYQELIVLPGIGPYTAHAVLAFAYNQEVPVIDTNIRRVLIWELDLAIDIAIQELESIALSCVPEGKSNDRHNALMDYGALVVTVKMTGIKPLSKQSRFKGSDREVRGWIMKQLVNDQSITFTHVVKQFPKKNVSNIILGLAKDGLIEMKGEQLEIRN